ncbi:MAG TPA: hypothetical protein VG942_17270, partial [Hyphomonadaceae bacterium]|nr:hypothetical protein [Hyphomonadaceae bacterium]
DLAEPPNFSILEGNVSEVNLAAQDSLAILSPAGIALHASPALGPPDTQLDLRANTRLRLRGRIDARDGDPKIRLTHWAQVEMA